MAAELDKLEKPRLTQNTIPIHVKGREMISDKRKREREGGGGGKRRIKGREGERETCYSSNTAFR